MQCSYFNDPRPKCQGEVIIILIIIGLLQTLQHLGHQSLSFACSILAYWRKTLHELKKIFVEHARHVARI